MPRVIKNLADRFTAARTRTTTSNGSNPADTLAALLKITGAGIEKAEVGGGVVIPVPGIDNLDSEANKKAARKFMAGIRGKIIPITREGGPWAGQSWGLTIDKNASTGKPEVLMVRQPDLEKPLPKKAGGRPKGSQNKATLAGLEAARAHLNGGDGTVITDEGAAASTPEADNSNDVREIPAGTTQVRDLTARKGNKKAA